MSTDQSTQQAVRKHKADLAYWRRQIRKFSQHLYERNMEDKRREERRNTLTAIAAVAIAAAVLFMAFAANAQSRVLTGGELLQSYNAGGTAQDISGMYIAGVIDGMSGSGTICVPDNPRKDDAVQQVVYNLGANEQLHERRFDIAVSSAAVMAYPCGEAS